jgi:hypothetical protein
MQLWREPIADNLNRSINQWNRSDVRVTGESITGTCAHDSRVASSYLIHCHLLYVQFLRVMPGHECSHYIAFLATSLTAFVKISLL